MNELTPELHEAMEKAVAEVNAVRAKGGLPPVTVDYIVERYGVHGWLTYRGFHPDDTREEVRHD